MTPQYALVARAWHTIAPGPRKGQTVTECGLWVLPGDERGEQPDGDRCGRCVP